MSNGLLDSGADEAEAALEASSLAYNPPLERDLGLNGGKVGFRKVYQFQRWIEDEVDWWRDLPGHESIIGDLFKNAVKKQLDPIYIAISGNLKNIRDSKCVLDILDAFESYRCIHSSSPLGQAIRDLAVEDAFVAGILLASQVAPELLSEEIPASKLLEAAVHLAMAKSPLGEAKTLKIHCEKVLEQLENTRATAVQAANGVAATVEKFEKAAGDAQNLPDEVLYLQTQLDRMREKAQTDFSDALIHYATEVTALQEQHKSKLEQMESALQTRVDIKASEMLWRGKRQGHRWVVGAAGAVFAAGLAALSYASFVYGTEYLSLLGFALTPLPTVGNAGGAGSEVARLVVAAVPVMAAVWFLRVAARIFFTNISQLSDASERIAMIHTFLSLEKEGHITEGRDRVLMLQALFRPGPGGTADDSMPPNWFDLMMQRLEPSKGK
jgi:hypothetical protein